MQSGFDAHLRIAGQERDADLAWSCRRDINLAAPTPVHFHEISPGSDGEMASESESRGVQAARSEVSAFSDDRLLPIGSHEPRRVRRAIGNASSPPERNADFISTLNQKRVKRGAAQTKRCRTVRQLTACRGRPIAETDSGDGKSDFGI